MRGIRTNSKVTIRFLTFENIDLDTKIIFLGAPQVILSAVDITMADILNIAIFRYFRSFFALNLFRFGLSGSDSL